MKYVSSFLLMFLIACSPAAKDTKPVLVQVKKPAVKITKPPMTFDSLRQNNTQPEALVFGKTDSGVNINFQHFILKIDSLSVVDPEHKLREIQEETAFVPVEKGETIDGKNVEILQNSYDRIAVYQRYENNIFLTDDTGKKCDLIKWKSYLSKWKQLKVNENRFRLDRYTQKDGHIFEKMSVKSFKNAVKEHCGTTFYKNIAQRETSVKDIKRYIATDKVYLKIVLENSKTGTRIEKLIIFELPVGA